MLPDGWMQNFDHDMKGSIGREANKFCYVHLRNIVTFTIAMRFIVFT